MSNAAHWCYYLKVAGFALGDATGGPADGMVRLCTIAPLDDPGGAYVPAMWAFPTEKAEEVSFIDSTLELGAQEFELRSSPRQTFENGHTLARTFLRAKKQFTAKLVSQVLAASTNLPTDDTSGGLANTYIWIGRECIRVGTHAGSGLYTGCLRARAGTVAQDHLTDFEIYDYMHVLTDRRVVFGRVPYGGSYSDEEDLWVGALTDLDGGVAGEGQVVDVLRFKCESIVSLIQQRPLMEQQWRATVTAAQYLPQESASTWLQASGDVAAQGYPIATSSSASRMAVQVDGGPLLVMWAYHVPSYSDSQQVLLSWFPEHEAADGAFRVQPDQPIDQIGNLEGKEAWEVVLVGDLQPAGDGTTALPTNPIALARSLLTGSHGIEQLSCRIPEEHLDTESWDALELEFSGFSCSHLVLGIEGEPVDAWELITKRIFHAIQVVFTRIGGLWGVARFGDELPYGSTDHLQEANWLAPPQYVRNLPSAFDTVALKVADYIGHEGRTVRGVGAFERARNLYGRRRSLEVDCTAYSAPAQMAQWAATRWVEQFNFGYPYLTGYTDGRLQLYPGQRVLVSHSLAWSPSGELGLDSLVCLVLASTLRTGEEGEDQTFEVVLLCVGYPVDRAGYISGSMRVTDYDGATKRVEVESFFFCDSGDAPLGSDPAAFEVGDLVDFTDINLARYGGALENVEITAITVGQTLAGATNPAYSVITLDPAFTGAPAAGDTIILSDHDQQDRANQLRWAWQAGTDGEVDTATSTEPGTDWNA